MHQQSFKNFYHLSFALDTQNATLTVLPHYYLKNCERKTDFVHKEIFFPEQFPLDTRKARLQTLLKHFPVGFRN